MVEIYQIHNFWIRRHLASIFLRRGRLRLILIGGELPRKVTLAFLQRVLVKVKSTLHAASLRVGHSLPLPCAHFFESERK